MNEEMLDNITDISSNNILACMIKRATKTIKHLRVVSIKSKNNFFDFRRTRTFNQDKIFTIRYHIGICLAFRLA